MVSAGDVVEISSDEEDFPVARKLFVSVGPLGSVAKLFDDLVVIGESPVQPQKKGESYGVGVGDCEEDDDDDSVVLDGDPDGAVAVAGEKGIAGDGCSDELEIVAEKGQVACRDFPHSRHLCSNLPFGTTSHLKHCSMCYCYVCDAPAPCNYWGKGLLINDHCHATDKETKWKTLRQAFKCRSLPAPRPEKHQNVVYPTMPSPRQQEEDEEYTSEDEEEIGEYVETPEEATVYAGNLSYDTDSECLAQLFEQAGTIEFSEELDGRLLIVNSAAPRNTQVERPPHQFGSSSFRIYVGNLPWQVDNYELEQLFSEYGEVVDAEVVYNYRRETRRSRGFGFVTMATPEESEDAIAALDGQIFEGRELRVNIAKKARPGAELEQS